MACAASWLGSAHKGLARAGPGMGCFALPVGPHGSLVWYIVCLGDGGELASNKVGMWFWLGLEVAVA